MQQDRSNGKLNKSKVVTMLRYQGIKCEKDGCELRALIGTELIYRRVPHA